MRIEASVPLRARPDQSAARIAIRGDRAALATLRILLARLELDESLTEIAADVPGSHLMRVEVLP